MTSQLNTDPAPPEPCWAQPGFTDVAIARAFFDALRSRDTLALLSTDGDIGYPLTRRNQRFRGHFASVCRNVVAATPPPPDLVAYHRSLGLGPEQVFYPASISASARLAALVLKDPHLLARIGADTSLTRILVAFKNLAAERLIERLGLTPVYCSPPSGVYEAANDKLRFAQAGREYGFNTLAMEVASDPDVLDVAFRSLSEPYGAGCIVRLRRGAGGHHVYHARISSAARRIWRRLRDRGEVLVGPYIPPSLVVRNVASHGIVTAGGFAPLTISDQLVRNHCFRGGRVTSDWRADEICAVRMSLEAIGRWLGALGYADAPAGVDGFLIRNAEGLRFIALDPNIRLTGMMLPWAVVVALSEAAGQKFVWQFESFSMLGMALTLRRLRRRLGSNLLNPAFIERGGVLPSRLSTLKVGPLGASGLSVIFLAHDVEHLDYLRESVRRLAVISR